MLTTLLWSTALAAILVDAPEAARLAADPATVVLDVRGLPSYLAGHVPRAVRTDWREGTAGSSGKILPSPSPPTTPGSG